MRWVNVILFAFAATAFAAPVQNVERLESLQNLDSLDRSKPCFVIGKRSFDMGDAVYSLSEHVQCDHSVSSAREAWEQNCVLLLTV